MKTASKYTSEIPKTLQDTVLGLQQKIKQKDARIVQLEQNYQYLLEQLRLAQHRQFGKSSEVAPNQLGLFNETEEIQEEEKAEEATELESISYQRKKPKRKPLPENLPREVIVHDLDDADKVCHCCGNDLHKMGEEKSEQLEFIPAKLKVIEHVRLKYSCRHCEQNNTEVKIKIAARPLSPIPKGIATPSLLSQIISSKYQYALPLYRQETLFKQYGIGNYSYPNYFMRVIKMT